MSSAKITIARKAERDIKMRGLEIFLDGNFVKDLQFGGEIELPVEPGEHQLKISNNLYSKENKFTVGTGETVRFAVGNYFTRFGAAATFVLGIGPYKVFLDRLH